jgi:hypothetical protein
LTLTIFYMIRVSHCQICTRRRYAWVVIQFGKISHGVYPEYAERVRDDRPPFLFVISTECEKSFPVRSRPMKSNCTTTYA